MAKRVANILRAVLSLQQGDAAAVNIPLAQLAPHITRLPMPEDYTLEELRGLTQSYLRQLIVSQWELRMVAKTGPSRGDKTFMEPAAEHFNQRNKLFSSPAGNG